MNRKFIILVALMVIVALGLMFQAAQTGTAEVFTPSELAEKPVDTVLSRIRVVGRVSASSEIQYRTEPFAELGFAIENPGGIGGAPVKVVYRGIKPDMFTAGRDVIIDGEYREGLVHASSLLTQCPSKYEAPSPETKYGVTPVPSETL